MGHRKIWALTRHAGHKVSQATVLRLLRDEGLLLASQYHKQRRELAADRRAAFATPPDGPNQVWELDFSEFETTTGGTWRFAGCRDWYSKYEHPWHVSPTGNKHGAITAVELALADYEALFGHPLADACPIDPVTGEVLPVVTIVTDNGGPFRSIDFELFIGSHPELRRVRTRVKSPGQNGSRERGFGTLKYDRLFLDEIADALTLVERAEDYRIEYNTERPHETIAPGTGPSRSTSAEPARPSPPLNKKKSCQLLDAGHVMAGLTSPAQQTSPRSSSSSHQNTMMNRT